MISAPLGWISENKYCYSIRLRMRAFDIQWHSEAVEKTNETIINIILYNIMYMKRNISYKQQYAATRTRTVRTTKWRKTADTVFHSVIHHRENLRLVTPPPLRVNIVVKRSPLQLRRQTTSNKYPETIFVVTLFIINFTCEFPEEAVLRYTKMINIWKIDNAKCWGE